MADQVPAFDDIPSFDDLPDASSGNPPAQQAAGQVPAFDDIPAFDDLPDSQRPDQGPAPEGPFASAVREAAHAIIPAVAGTISAGVGGAAGTLAAPGPGTIAGGVAGFVAGSAGAGYLQEKALNALGYDDSTQRAANEQANPKSSFIGGLAPAVATMNPVSTAETIGKQLAQRGASAAMLGGFEAGGEALQGEDLSPEKIAIAAATGAVFPGVNKVGAKLIGAGERMIPGRPGRTANPAATQTHVDVDDPNAEIDVNSSALSQPPVPNTSATTGNPQSAPERSERNYGKGNAPAGPETDMLTQGDTDPATAAALQVANPPATAPEAPIPGFDDHPSGVGQSPRQASPVQSEEGLAEVSRLQRQGLENVRQKMAAQQLDQEPPPGSLNPDRPARAQAAIDASKGSIPKFDDLPVVETGFPKPGEPVAVGENEATPMPKIEGRTSPNAQLSDAQLDAGNHLKARTQDFGKPIAIETHAGDIRRSTNPDTPWEVKMPYDYGYFNKTVGPDGDHIDFARPAPGSPELGDKHFIIDQKDANTGKYDEPKVFTYVKDEATARDLFNRGFSDGKGPNRLHDITEVSRDDLVKFLSRHTKTPPKGPYGEPMPKTGKPLAERAVVKDLIAKGKTTPEAIAALPPEQVEQAIAGKRTRNYGVGTGASAGYPVEGVLTADGKPVTANTKATAAERSAIHKKVSDWFQQSAPKGDATAETNGALLDRLKQREPKVGSGWQPTFKPKEWLYAREAKRLLSKPSPANIAKFRDAERMLRGSDEDVANYRGGNRIEADIATSRRSGDEAIAGAEAAQHNPGVNDVEDAAIAAIDAKRKPGFDVPHEEAESMVEPTPVKTAADLKELPRRTVDVNDTALAKIDTNKISKDVLDAQGKRKAEAAALAGKRATANVPSEERSAGKGISVADKMSDPEYLKKLIEMSDKAAKKKSVSEADLAREDLTQQPSGRPAYNATAALFDKLREFGGNEEAALNVGKIKTDLKKMLETTPTKSYIARPGHPTLEPNADYTRSLSDELHALDNKNTLHEQNIRNDFLKKLPKEADQAMLARIFKARESDSAHVDLPGKQAGKTNIESLPPADKKVWDEHLKPLINEAEGFREYIKAIDPNLAGPDVDHYIARITKGNTSEFNLLRQSDDPVGRRNALSVNASMTNERPFVAMERVSDGERFVVQNRDNGFTLWDNNKATRIKAPDYEFKADQPYTIPSKTGNPVDVIMRHATTDEIMKSGARFDLGKDKNGRTQTMPAKYYQNAGLSAALAHAKLGTMARNIIELARLSSTPEFNKLSTRSNNYAKEMGWEESKMPNFKGTYMAPELREVFDDYAGPKGNAFDTLRNLNQAVTKLLFWTPTAHIANVGAHWFVGRGFDNLRPSGFKTSLRAMQSVMKQDHIQKEMMENGAGLIYPNVQTRNFIEQVAKGVGESMSKDPKSGWREIARKAGVPFEALHDAVYNKFSSKVMWAANDMFLTQRYLELKAKGMDPKEAIAKAERDIPNYRVPTRLGGGGAKGRALSLIAQDNTIFAFSRYHVGMMNAYSDMTRGIFGKNSTVGDRVEALGKLLALGTLAAAYPIVDYLAKATTGNPDATQNRRGPLSIPYHLNEALHGREDLASAARSTMTIQPFISTLMETYFNKDFRGKSIVEPGDVAAATKGDLRSAGKVGIQFGEHAARGLVSPVGTLENTIKKKNNPGEGIRDQLLDQKNPSDAARAFARKQATINYKNANIRQRKGGSGVLEDLYNKATR